MAREKMVQEFVDAGEIDQISLTAKEADALSWLFIQPDFMQPCPEIMMFLGQSENGEQAIRSIFQNARQRLQELEAGIANW